jgi:hypothetical protein
MVEDGLEAVAMRIAQEQAARIAPIVAELLAALADRGGIDQRQRLC